MTTKANKSLSEREIKLLKRLLTDLRHHLNERVNAGFKFFKAVDYEDELNELSIKDSFLEMWDLLDVLKQDTANMMHIIQVRRGDLKTLIYLLQLTLFALDVQKDKKQLENLSPNSRILVDEYYPTDANFHVLKTKLFDCYFYMTYYFACKNMVMAFKKLTGLGREIEPLARFAGMERPTFSPRGLTFEESHFYYKQATDIIENDFNFVLTCLKELKSKKSLKIKYSIPVFELSRFRPKDENVNKCIEEILANKTDFMGAYASGEIKKLEHDIEQELITYERYERGLY